MIRSPVAVDCTNCLRIAVLLLPLYCLDARLLFADELPSVTPYRPTVSNPAELSAPRHVEVEAGFEHVNGGGLKERLATPLTLKYAFNEDWGLLLNSGWMYEKGRDDGVVDGWNPSALLLKSHYALNEDNAVGIELGVGTPALAGYFAEGDPDLVVNLIYSVDIGETRFDANFGMTRIGWFDDETNVDRHQYQWALALSHPVSNGWSVAAELSGNARYGSQPYQQALVCASYALSRTTVIDAGGAYGVGGDSAATRNLFIGVSMLID